MRRNGAGCTCCGPMHPGFAPDSGLHIYSEASVKMVWNKYSQFQAAEDVIGGWPGAHTQRLASVLVRVGHQCFRNMKLLRATNLLSHTVSFEFEINYKCVSKRIGLLCLVSNLATKRNMQHRCKLMLARITGASRAGQQACADGLASAVLRAPPEAANCCAVVPSF